MKVLLIGHSGTVGKAVYSALAARNHDVITAARTSGDIEVDITDQDSILRMFESVGSVDGIVVASGTTPFTKLPELTQEDFMQGWQHKAQAQINILLCGLKYINDEGSVALTSGILAQQPIARGVVASTVNGALESFVRAAATEMPRRVRVNIVSPTIIEESMQKYEPYFPGFEPVPAVKVASAYVRAVEGVETGKTFQVW